MAKLNNCNEKEEYPWYVFRESSVGEKKTAEYGEGHFGAGLHKSGFTLCVDQ